MGCAKSKSAADGLDWEEFENPVTESSDSDFDGKAAQPMGQSRSRLGRKDFGAHLDDEDDDFEAEIRAALFE